MKPCAALQWRIERETAMKGESILRRFRLALAAIVVGVVGGLTGDGPESWAQVPATPGAVGTQAAPVVVKVEGEVSTPLRLTAAELNAASPPDRHRQGTRRKGVAVRGGRALRCPQESGPADWQGSERQGRRTLPGGRGGRRLSRGLCPARARSGLHRQSDPPGRPPRRAGTLVPRRPASDRRSR